MNKENNKLYRWFSICSTHSLYNKECPRCNVGGWTFMPFYYLSNFIYKISPSVWRKFANSRLLNKQFADSFTHRDGSQTNLFPNTKINTNEYK